MSVGGCKHCGERLVPEAAYCTRCGFFVGVETAETEKAVLMAEYKEASIELRAALQAGWIFLTIGMTVVVFASAGAVQGVGSLAVEFFILITLAGSAFRKWIRLYRAKSDFEEEQSAALKQFYEKHPIGPGKRPSDSQDSV
jgi:hypothetical protein